MSNPTRPAKALAPQTAAPAAPSAGKAGGEPAAGKALTTGKAVPTAGKAAVPTTLGPSQFDITTLAVPQTNPPPRRALPPEDPPLIGVYSGPDRGKTTDLGFCCPTDNTLWITDPGALEPVHAICKYKPTHVYKDARTVKDITEVIAWAAEQGFTSVAIDDWAGKMQASLAGYRREGVKGKSGEEDGFYPYNSLNDDLMEQRTTARYCGIGVLGNFWEDPPKNQKGKQKKGGPGIPGNKGKEIITTFLDLLLRGSANPSYKPWSGVYLRYPITDMYWITKDRFALNIPEMPQNLGEILRFAGFGLPGSPWVPERRWDWQEAVVDEIAEQMWYTGKDAEVGREAFIKLLDGNYPGVGKTTIDAVEWTMRDAVDRVRLWRLSPKTDSSALAARFGWGA